MLFSRIYNWIKYKTLPPSVLYLNRLFVERDSKHRRVTSNLGLTFRNSKWSSYARTNINLNSRSNYFSSLGQFISILLFVLLLSKTARYYSLSITPLWFLLDADLYLKIVFSSSLICSLQLLVSSSYNKLFSSLFSTEIEAKGTNLVTLNETLSIPQRLHKPIIYKWLTISTNLSTASSVFSSQLGQSTIDLYGPLLKSLYQLTHSLRQVETNRADLTRSIALLAQNVPFQTTPTTLTALNLFESKSSPLALLLDYKLGLVKQKSSTRYFDELDRWAIRSIQNEFDIYQNLPQTPQGLLYVTNLSYSELNLFASSIGISSTIKDSVENQLSFIRWNRWLYKYNILHRLVIKNSTYLTLTKRLLGTGFYSSSLLTNNLWASSTFNSNNNNFSQIVAPLTKELYSDYGLNSFRSPTILRSNSSWSNEIGVEALKFYENSYYWFIQRFYQLNTLAQNTVISLPRLNESNRLDLVDSFNNYSNLSAQFSLHVSSNLHNFTSSLEDDDLQSTYTNAMTWIKPRSAYLDYCPHTYFTKSNIELTHNLVKNQTSAKLKFFTHNNSFF
jgi:hypothetical protein